MFPDENNGPDPPNSLPNGLDSPGKLITWYNLGKQQHQQPDRVSRSRFREENSLNNNTSSGRDDTRKSKSLPDIGRERETRYQFYKHL